MFFGFKYHVFTITAIFAALGIGILIGTSLISEDLLVQEQERLIENIRNDINKINKENIGLRKNIEELNEEIEYRKDMEQRILSLFVQDEFAKENYILDTGEENREKNKNKIEEIGLNIRIIEEIQNLEDKDFSKIILWNNEDQEEKLQKYQEKLPEKSEEIIAYNKPDLIGLIMKIMESEINDF